MTKINKNDIKVTFSLLNMHTIVVSMASGRTLVMQEALVQFHMVIYHALTENDQ